MNDVDVVEYLQEVLEEVAYLAVEADQPLVIDSLIAAQVKWRVDLDLDVDLPLEEYVRGSALREIAALIEAGMLERSPEVEAGRP